VSRVWGGLPPVDPYLLRVVEAATLHLVARQSGEAERESAWSTGGRSPAAPGVSFTADVAKTAPRPRHRASWIGALAGRYRYVSLMSSQPSGVTTARSSWRSTTVVVEDSTMAGPLTSRPARTDSRS
jgi:hypothetical protein